MIQKQTASFQKSKSKERYNAINRSIDNVLSDIKELIEGNDKKPVIIKNISLNNIFYH